MRNLPYLLFDALFLLFAFVVYGASATAAIAVADVMWAPPVWRRGLALVAAYFTFIHAFVLVVGIVKRIVQRPLREGVCDVGLNRHYFAWGLNSVFQGLFTTAFFDRQVHLVFYLRWAYYRAMGMKLPFNAIIGTRVMIRQAELIELGDKAVVGERSTLACHMTPDGKRHVQGRIRIGAGSVIGAHAMLGPDTVVGERSVVGAMTSVTPGVRIGDNVKIGAACHIGGKVVLSDGVRIMPASYVRDGTIIGPDETWGGNPAVRIEKKKKP